MTDKRPLTPPRTLEDSARFAAKLVSFLASRALAENEGCVAWVANTMAREEVGREGLEKMPEADKKKWELRARVAIVALDRWLRDRT